MTTKAELLEQAQAAGLDVNGSSTKADIEAALAEHEAQGGDVPGVVRSSERHPLTDVPAEGEAPTKPAGADSATDLDEATHFHQSAPGPENSPAGAHRHEPFDPPHDHRPVSRPEPEPFVNPRPNAATEGDEEGDDVAVTVDRDCSVVVNDQLVKFYAGQRVEGSLGRYLTETGAPVSPAS
jgi:hypothetical protein